ncbi:MAG TPA: amidohydrolase [Thermoanaerobaculia bacterium]|nr:amidohydrolase [Thermoanaerobaculia bacterium]
MRRTSLASAPLLLLFLLFTSPARAVPAADVVLHNGKIFTVDAGRPWAQAVAIRGSRIVAVGNNGPVRALAGPGTRSIDRGGRVVVPGFNDAHAHLGVGFPRLTLPPINIPGPGPTLAEALDQVAQAVAMAEPGEWILAFVGEALILDPAATRLAIDPVAPNNPVILLTWSSHSAVINTQAMAVGGIAPNQPDPFGGSYDRFPGTNIVNGVIHEYGFFRLVRPFRGIVPDEVLRAQFEAFSALAAQVGVTSVQEMTIGLTKERSERVLAGADLKVRLRTMCVPMELEESCQPHSFDLSDRLTSSGIKWILDGTPVERSAALREPWADHPGTGRFNVTNSQLSRLIRRSLFGLPIRNQLLMHTFGDRAIDKALAELDRAAPAIVWRLLRPRIEHGDMLHPEQIDLARRLGVIVVQNPTHLTLDLEPSLGPDRAAAAQPLRSLLDAGVHLAFGSDSPQPNPFVDLFFAVLHPFHPGEALTMEEAVTAYTRGSAMAEFQEWQKGSIRPGYLADLAVLSQDIFTIPPPAVPETVSLLTLVGGEVVWDAGVLVP